MEDSLWLHSAELAVEVRPAKGADIASITDRSTGIDVLFHAPWGRCELSTATSSGNSEVDWLARYGGGWQQLVPNAGASRIVDGVQRGYHGEAAVVAWKVLQANDKQASMSVDLLTAPLHLTRSLRVEGPVLRIFDAVENTSGEPVAVMWVQHPGFGAPFIDQYCTLTTGALSLISDACMPGNLLSPDARTHFPNVPTDSGHAVDLSVVPAPESRRSVFACLTEFTDAWFAIDSPTAGFGIRVEWELERFPYAWFWQECHATSTFPWYGRAYVVAVEPANVIPGDPSANCPSRGQSPLLAGKAKWTTELTFTRTDLSVHTA